MTQYHLDADQVCQYALEKIKNAVNQKVASRINNHKFCVIFRPALKLYYLSKINYCCFKKKLNLYSAKDNWCDTD